ncbi:MAG: hypothetical protein IJ138_04030, partial [Clostridia bacterium]|nr:hypothetical protein [Clostridia bacterium]
MTVSLKDVSAALVKLSEEFGLASAAAGDLSEKLTKDLLAVNEKISELYTAVFDAALADPAERISDVSEVMLSEMREGKVASCQNSGSITGDVNVGGIAGTMGFESLLDPENDLESAFTLLRDNLYEYRAALSGCRNFGRVSAKRSYAGGVCGKMTIGIIDDSINYGAVASETGSYVGGIAGLTQAKVHGSFAKCTVSGKSYIGGIVGSGYTDSAEQSGSLVSDCVAVVSVSADGQFAGTVAGGAEGLYRANRYLADELGGINGIGYAEQAEPISYRSLQTLSELPTDFSALTVTFVADGRTVKTVSVGYGDSLLADSFPPVPYQQGSYGRWDRTALKDVTRDTVVTALYYPYETALASDAVRADGRPVFFAQGLFSDTDVLLAEPMPQQTELFPVLIGNGEAAIREYFSCFSQGTLPQAEIGFLLREQWRLTLPEDGSASHTVRMTLPDAQTEHLRFYEKHDDTWTQIPYTAIGQYAVLNLSSANPEVAVVSTKSVVWAWLLLLSLLAGVL